MKLRLELSTAQMDEKAASLDNTNFTNQLKTERQHYEALESRARLHQQKIDL